jgi:hypothetical protein
LNLVLALPDWEVLNVQPGNSALRVGLLPL